MPLAVRTLPLATFGAAALLGLVAVLDPFLAVAGAVGIGFGLLMLADVSLGLCIFAFSAALFEAIPEFGAFSVAKALGGALALSWIAAINMRGSGRDEVFGRQPGYAALLVFLALWCGLSALWADDSSITQSDWIRLFLNLLLIPIAFSAVRDVRTLRLLVGALLAGMLLSAAYGYLLSPGSVEDAGRLGGAGLDPNYLALWLVIAGTLGAGVAVRRRMEPFLRWVTAGGAGVCFLAALATASRTGVIAMAVVLVGAPLVMGRGRRVALALMAICLASVGTFYVVAVAPASVREHISDTEGGGSGRTDIWKVGVRMVEAKPVLGVGLGNFQTSSIHYLLAPGTIRRSDYIVDQPKVAHNTYLQLAAETGLVGLGLYLAIAAFGVGAAGAAARRFERAGMRDESLLARCVVLATLAGLAGSAFITLEYTKPLWLLLALGPVTLNLARRAVP